MFYFILFFICHFKDVYFLRLSKCVKGMSGCAKSVLLKFSSNGLPSFVDVSGERKGDAAAPWAASRGHCSALQLPCWLPVGRF